MINSLIIPIIKNKYGDFTDKDSYRPIALSSIISKVFEHTCIIIIRLEEYLWTNGKQFEFKSGRIYVLTEFIEYIKSRPTCTSVYITFLDASKAYLVHKVSHWTLC